VTINSSFAAIYPLQELRGA